MFRKKVAPRHVVTDRVPEPWVSGFGSAACGEIAGFGQFEHGFFSFFTAQNSKMGLDAPAQ